MQPFLESLEASAIGLMVRESMWGFVLVVGAHILGLGLSVGIVAWLDLRLLGIGIKTTPISAVYRRLMPWAFAGFFVMVVTGVMLFVAYATAAFSSGLFRLKLLAMLLAAVNAAAYHFLTEPGIARWDTAACPPLGARVAGACSLLLWLSVILLGRGLSYTLF